MDEFYDQLKVDCDVYCGQVDYQLVYADTGVPVSADLATLSEWEGKVVINASTEESSFAGNHKVKIVGKSQYTEP